MLSVVDIALSGVYMVMDGRLSLPPMRKGGVWSALREILSGEVIHIILSILGNLCSIAGFALAVVTALSDRKKK
jgi:hypothetical protein